MTDSLDPISPETPGSASVVATLRKLLMDGRYPAGSRLAEIPVAQALGVSRTPVRLAFRTLEQEGLLQKAGARGFVVRAFSEDDVLCAVEVRGALEGLAARRLAERGLGEALRAALQACVAEGAQVLDAAAARGTLDEEALAAWSRLNAQFHRLIVEGTDSRVIADAIARNNHLPFASADSIVIDRSVLDREVQKLRLAQMQHVLVVDALQGGEGARVEALMREHAWIGFRYSKLFGLPPARVGPG